uniref:uncharacterized protein LOC113475732 isoform X2 n=1 Tax=Ciona intestinalis TaxID=7719 RepID=UPI000EF50AE5|nr:uncharacterized protein LOC113475732 isoform X2 [Ciona intestinalis]|eukprot:XP_026696191.1 uncharacterized protein LOC113475732 isoform X2 [Ciona intestinalis]
MFASHLHKLKKRESPICDEEDETSFYYVGICPAYANARREHLNLTELSRRTRRPPETQRMAGLPLDRSEESSPFTYSAVDFFGPFYIKERRSMLKCYGVVFTCMASRAVHLESANSLDTISFINSLRRFLCRRGEIKQLRSDQGTNFVGARNELHKYLKRTNGR